MPTHPPLSVQLYTVRDALAVDPAAAIDRLAGLGVDAVEPFDLVDWADRLAGPLAASGLRAGSAHARLLRDDDLGPVFDAAARLGVATVFEPTVHDGWGDAAGVERIADAVNRASAAAAPHGLAVGYHNHWWEFGELGGQSAYERFVELLDPAVVLEVDAYWAAVGGADVPALLGRLGSRVTHLHVKDGPLDLVHEAQVPAGSGRAGLDAVLAAAPDATRVLEFDGYAGDVFAALAASARWVRSPEFAR